MLRVLLALGLVCAIVPTARAENKLAEKITGTWVRVVEDHKVTLEIAPDGLRFKVVLPGGVTVAAEADYVVSKDGILIGIVRAKAADKPEDKDAIRDRTFGGLVTVTEKTLTVKEFECQQDDVQKLVEGTFKRSSKDATARAAAKSKPVRAGMTLPTSSYQPHPPQYFRPEPSFPLNRELSTTAPSSPACVESSRFVPETLLEYLADYVFGGFFINSYSSDPNRRIVELLNQSEVFGPIENEFKLFWFIDQPSHMTYERIHGGIQ